jgi:hypothetical protein
MKNENKLKWVAVAAILAASCFCAAVASCCRALNRTPYLTLGSASSTAPQTA